ncbi:MAG: mechanosensitive ion channel, partial [Saprospiraceae bacterium]|nr:mechanosensitive ion channel [Saprospiraceae bacterium]
MESFSNFLEIELLSVGNYTIKVYTLITIALIFIITKLFLIVTKRLLLARAKRYKIDEGNTYALYRIISYVVWVIAIGLLLETIGIKVTVLIAGSAALLVGIGLGLQQTFNDIISGIILISEKSIRINDVLEVD